MTTGGAAAPAPAQAGAEFAAYVSEQLETEEKRRASFESRGLAVITTSGTIVTLVFAFVALVTQRKGFRLPDAAHPWLISALVAFVAAAAAGVATNAPQLYRAVDPAALAQIVRDRWFDAADDALKTLTATRLEDLQRAQTANDLKGRLLLAASLAEGVGIGCVAVAVATILAA